MGGAPISRISASERRTASVTVKNQHPPPEQRRGDNATWPEVGAGGDGVGRWLGRSMVG